MVQQRSPRALVSRIQSANSIVNARFMVAAAAVGALALETGLSVPQRLLFAGMLNAGAAGLQSRQLRGCDRDPRGLPSPGAAHDLPGDEGCADCAAQRLTRGLRVGVRDGRAGARREPMTPKTVTLESARER